MSHSEVADAKGGSEATLGTYSVGFILAIVLTVIPFGFVAFAGLSKIPTLSIVAVTAVIQILVHLYFFLHLDASREHRANTMTGIFTVLILGVLVGGTIWLFASLMPRTMPMSGDMNNMQTMSQTQDMSGMSSDSADSMNSSDSNGNDGSASMDMQ